MRGKNKLVGVQITLMSVRRNTAISQKLKNENKGQELFNGARVKQAPLT